MKFYPSNNFVQILVKSAVVWDMLKRISLFIPTISWESITEEGLTHDQDSCNQRDHVPGCPWSWTTYWRLNIQTWDSVWFSCFFEKRQTRNNPDLLHPYQVSATKSGEKKTYWEVKKYGDWSCWKTSCCLSKNTLYRYLNHEKDFRFHSD